MKRLTASIPLRMTMEERDYVKNEAAKDGVSFAAWIRNRINSHRESSRLDGMESRINRIESLLADMQKRVT